jgi:hypothetical protein
VAPTAFSAGKRGGGTFFLTGVENAAPMEKLSSIQINPAGVLLVQYKLMIPWAHEIPSPVSLVYVHFCSTWWSMGVYNLFIVIMRADIVLDQCPHNCLFDP